MEVAKHPFTLLTDLRNLEYLKTAKQLNPSSIQFSGTIITEIEQANAELEVPPECPQDKLFVPETLRERTMTKVHTSFSLCHPGINATIQLLQNQFWWPSLRNQIPVFVLTDPVTVPV